MSDTTIIANISEIVYQINGNYITQNVDITQSFVINEVINNFQVSTNQPFCYTVGTQATNS